MRDVYLEAEQAVLGAFLIDGELIKDTVLKFADQFSEPKHQLIFAAMKRVDKEGEAVDVVTVTAQLQNAGKIKVSGGVEYLANLMNSVPTVVNFDHYERLVIESWKIRATKQLGLKSQELSEVDAISNLIDRLKRIEEYGHGDDYDHQATVQDVFATLTTPLENGLPGINTGYVDLNRMTGGVQGKQLILLAARPAVGKSQMAINIARNVAHEGHMTTIFSLEMSREAIIQRMISAEGRIDSQKMKFRTLSEADYPNLIRATGVIHNLLIKIFDTLTPTVQEIRAKAKKVIREHPEHRHLIIIDYLQLVKSNSRKANRNEEVSEISRELKLLTMELDVPVIALCQLNRNIESRQDKRPTMGDLRDSGSLEQDADQVWFLHRDDYYDPASERRNMMELIIAKQREGPVGTIELSYMKQWNLIQNLQKK